MVLSNYDIWMLYPYLIVEQKMCVKEARNSFSFFQTNEHILSLDKVRVIISRQNLARVLSTHYCMALSHEDWELQNSRI